VGIEERSWFKMHLQLYTPSLDTWSKERHHPNRTIRARILPEGDWEEGEEGREEAEEEEKEESSEGRK
jgi:hypothetical protein